MEDEEKRFQLDLVKTQLYHSTLNETQGIILKIAFPLFGSLAFVYVGFGLTTQNYSYTLLGAICIAILIPIMYFLGQYFRSEKAKKNIKDEIEREFKPLYDKYLPNDSKDAASTT